MQERTDGSSNVCERKKAHIFLSDLKISGSDAAVLATPQGLDHNSKLIHYLPMHACWTVSVTKQWEINVTPKQVFTGISCYTGTVLEIKKMTDGKIRKAKWKDIFLLHFNDCTVHSPYIPVDVIQIVIIKKIWDQWSSVVKALDGWVHVTCIAQVTKTCQCWALFK